jgi:beta-lactamase class A
MIVISDNTATETVLKLVGKENVDAYMHKIGLTKTHVVMSIRDLFFDFLGVEEGLSSEELIAMAEEREPDRTSLAYSDSEDNNVSTPYEMNLLMEKIFKAEVLTREACDKILEIMLKQQLNDRIPRFLPKGTRVAHKTGTLFPGLRNDSGIIYINENSHCAVTIFTKTDPAISRRDIYEEVADATKIDVLMGRIARSVYDYFAQGRE